MDNKPVLIKDAIADDSNPERQKAAIEFMAKLERGEARICAPFPGMGIPWTKEKKEELYVVLREMFPDRVINGVKGNDDAGT